MSVIQLHSRTLDNDALLVKEGEFWLNRHGYRRKLLVDPPRRSRAVCCLTACERRRPGNCQSANDSVAATLLLSVPNASRECPKIGDQWAEGVTGALEEFSAEFRRTKDLKDPPLGRTGRVAEPWPEACRGRGEVRRLGRVAIRLTAGATGAGRRLVRIRVQPPVPRSPSPS